MAHVEGHQEESPMSTQSTTHQRISIRAKIWFQLIAAQASAHV